MSRCPGPPPRECFTWQAARLDASIQGREHPVCEDERFLVAEAEDREWSTFDSPSPTTNAGGAILGCVALVAAYRAFAHALERRRSLRDPEP